MVLGIIAIGMLVGMSAASVALFAGYSILMCLWFYTLFGCLSSLAIGSFAVAIDTLLRVLREREARPTQTQ